MMKYKCLEKLEKKPKTKSKLMSFINKFLSAILIGLIIVVTMEYSPKFKSFMQEEVLSKNISFGFIGKLYNKYFGNVLPTSEEEVVQVFKEKIQYLQKEEYCDGWKLTVQKDYLVPAIDSGIVVFIGDDPNYGKIITIEQEDKATITYGNIKNTDIKLYDYVIKGSYLGEIEGNILYLVILKDNNYLDVETYLS